MAVAGIDGRQQRGPPLYQRFLIRFPGLTIGAPGAVVIPGGVSDIGEVRGLSAARGQGGQQQTQGRYRAPLHCIVHGW